jgi:hypothetical protein
VKSLVEALVEERVLPPIEVDPKMRVIDGVHRYFAYKELDHEKVDVLVLDLGEDECWERAVQANGEHGLAISLEDRRDAFARMWEHHLAKDLRNKKTSIHKLAREVFCVSRNTIKRWIDDKEPEHRAVNRPPTAPRPSQESTSPPARAGGAVGGVERPSRGPRIDVPVESKETKVVEYLRSAFLMASDGDVDEIGLRAAIDAIPQDHTRANFIIQSQTAWPKIRYVMDAWLKEVTS